MRKICILLVFLLSACDPSYNSVLRPPETQAQTRNYQSRVFESSDRDEILRNIISTMQDLGFILNKADEKLGVVSGTSFINSSKLTVSVRQTGKNHILVRANAQAGLNSIDDPAPYQNFFNALSQSFFLNSSIE